MPLLKSSKITLLYNNLFPIFVGLLIGLNFYLSIPFKLITILLITSFIYYRFNLTSAIIFLISSLIGLAVNFIPHRLVEVSSIKGLIINSNDNYFIIFSKYGRYYIYQKEHPFRLGDIVAIKGKMEALDFQTIEGQFDFQSYLNSKGVYYQIKGSHHRLLFNPLRLLTNNGFINKLGLKDQLVIEALLFNQKDPSLVMEFEQLNLIHVFGVSGLVLYSLKNLLMKLLNPFINEKYTYRIVNSVLLSWLLINPFSVILWRYFVNEIIKLINAKWLNNQLHYFDRKGFLGIIMLLISRYLVNNPSFYLSFAISTIFYISKAQGRLTFKNKLFYLLLPWLILLPYLVITQNTINLMAILLAPIFIFINSGLILLSLFQFYLIPLPILLRPFLNITYYLLNFAHTFKIIVQFNLYTLIAILIFYLLLLILLKVRQLKVKQWNKYMMSNLFIFLLFMMIPYQALLTEAVYFINVGQGDAILIQNRRQAILVDTGGLSYLDVAQVSLIPFMKKQGINKLEAVIISHNDFDHNGALPSLVDHFKVNHIIKEAHQFPITIANITFTNLNVYANDNEDDNYQSLVLYFHFMNAYWLMMADAPIAIEQQIINSNLQLPVDYLKIGHHGSNTSTCEAFLDFTMPKEVIISVGHNNYGHPHQQVITLLNKKAIKIRRTDQEGTIVYKKSAL